MPRLAVRIEPIDPLLFGDNRSARAGEDHALADQDPTPATLYGAVGGRIAAALGAAPSPARWAPAEPVLGPLVPTLKAAEPPRSQLLGYALCDAAGQRWFPRPLHLRVRKLDEPLDPIDLLQPVRLEHDGVVTSLAGLARLAPAPGAAEVIKKQEAEEALWVEEPLLRAILAAETTNASLESGYRVAAAEAFYAAEDRVGLTLSNATNAAVEGRLFRRPYRRFASGVQGETGGWAAAGFTAWFEVLRLAAGQPAAWSGEGFVGGDRGRALFDFTALDEEPLAALRTAVSRAAPTAAGFLAYLLTPAVASNETGLRLHGQAPIAVATGRPLYASGWNAVARPSGPRPIRVLVPAGSVFFYDWPPGCEGEARSRLVERLWLTAADPAFAAAGFGRLLSGVWKEGA